MSNEKETRRLRDFWNKRYVDFSVQESGIISLSPKTNQWMYHCKENTYRRALRRARFDFHQPVRLLDGGCGQGFFVSLSKQLFDQLAYTGIDVSDKAIEHLRRGHPDCHWICADIGVLHLIIDDEHHRQAIRNLCEALAPGGTGLFTDMLPKNRFHVGDYLVYRPLANYRSVFSETRTQLIDILPMYYWLPEFTRAGNPLRRLDSLVPGQLIYWLDRLLLWSKLPQVRPSHDSQMKIMIVKKSP
jgi:SAM-dependent methyltransferase